MKKLLGLFLMMWQLLLSGCAISHTYGPYMGKVVAKDTGEPIEGAVVFVSFYTRLPTPGGPTSHYADATEVLTNEQGQFDIPLQWIWTFRPLHFWDLQPGVIIFKPGHGAFPGHRGTSISPKSNWFPAKEQIMIELPKLNTKQERGKNAGDGLSIDRFSVPYEKYKLLFGAVNEEYRLIGSEPLPDPRQFKWSK